MRWVATMPRLLVRFFFFLCKCYLICFCYQRKNESGDIVWKAFLANMSGKMDHWNGTLMCILEFELPRGLAPSSETKCKATPRCHYVGRVGPWFHVAYFRHLFPTRCLYISVMLKHTGSLIYIIIGCVICTCSLSASVLTHLHLLLDWAWASDTSARKLINYMHKKHFSCHYFDTKILKEQ